MHIRIGTFVLVGLLVTKAICAEEVVKNQAVCNPFGVLEFLHWNHSWNDYKYPDKKSIERSVKLMRKAGVGIVRMDFLWEEIEPRKGEFDFAKYDHIVDVVTKNKIQILGLLHYSAPWASGRGVWNCPPADNALFVRYALAVAGRYKDKVKYWEVWNEPDSGTYWSNQDGLKSYVALLKDVYTTVKKEVPGCKILNGGLAGGLSSVNKLYDNGAGAFFDILNIHIFDSPLNPSSVQRVSTYPKLAYKVMARNGDGNKKIWITEIGCPGVKKEINAQSWWMGDNPDEEQQAGWLKAVFAELTKDKAVEKIFWAFFRDCRHWHNGTDYLGLVRWDFSEKPSYSSFQNAAKK